MRHGLSINQMSQISGILDQEHGLEFLLKRGRHCSHKERNATWFVMVRIKNVTKYLTHPHSILSLREVQFEEEPIPYFELAPGECSSPQQFDDVSDESCSIVSNMFDNNMVVDEIVVDDSLSRPKWDGKIIQATWENHCMCKIVLF